MNMLADVEDYVRHRDACQVNKASTKSYAALVYSWQVGAHHIGLIIEAAKGRQRSIHWSSWTGCLRWCMSPAIPTVEALDVIGFARLFRASILRLHGMPDSVMSDRGRPQFNICVGKKRTT